MAIQVTETKLVSEAITMEFDMISRLAFGRVAVTSAVSCEVVSGTDPLASAMAPGMSTLSGTIVSQRIIGGVAGNIYLVSCAVGDDANNVLINQSNLAVLSSPVLSP